MASRPEPRMALAPFVAAVALTALLWWLGTGVAPLWWATWLASLPVLVYAMRATLKRAFAAAFLGWAIGGLNVLDYDRMIHLPWSMIAVAILVPALLYALAVLLARALALRGRAIAAALALPALWTTFEFTLASLSPHGTFNNLAYTQMDALPVIQIAAVCGIWAISFVVLLFSGAIAAWTAPSTSRTAQRRLGVFAIAVFALVFGYGSWRLHAVPAESGVPTKIGLASLAGPVRAKLESAEGQSLLKRYLVQLEKLADDGAQTIVIPETLFISPDSSIPELAAFAQRRGVGLVAGVYYQKPGEPERNQAVWFAPGSGAASPYNKQHLLPGFEDQYRPGDMFVSVAAPANSALAVCKDMDFPALGRANADRGAHLLLVPAWDFELDGWLHSRMAILRGVESGFALARAARDGRLTLSDDRGRVLAEANSAYIDDAASVVGTLPVRDTQTLYARWGDWFAWIVVAVFAGCLVLAAMRTRSR